MSKVVNFDRTPYVGDGIDNWFELYKAVQSDYDQLCVENANLHKDNAFLANKVKLLKETLKREKDENYKLKNKWWRRLWIKKS